MKKLLTIFTFLFIMPAFVNAARNKYFFENQQLMVEDNGGDLPWSMNPRKVTKVIRPAGPNENPDILDHYDSPVWLSPTPTFNHPSEILLHLSKRKFVVNNNCTGWNVEEVVNEVPTVRPMNLSEQLLIKHSGYHLLAIALHGSTCNESIEKMPSKIRHVWPWLETNFHDAWNAWNQPAPEFSYPDGLLASLGGYKFFVNDSCTGWLIEKQNDAITTKQVDSHPIIMVPILGLFARFLKGMPCMP